MPAEHLRTAAVIGEGDKRFDRLILALAGTEIAFQPPEGGDDGGRHAEVLFLAREGRLVLLHLRGPVGKTSAGQHLVGYFEEVLSEEALPAVDIDDALIEHQVGRSRRDGGLRNALGGRLLLEVGEPRLEGSGVAAVRLGEGPRRGPHQQHRQHSPSLSHRLHRHCPRWFYHALRARCPIPDAELRQGTSCSCAGRFLLVQWQLAYSDRGLA